jgi:Spy/CpxP family protein refolding chaperone
MVKAVVIVGFLIAFAAGVVVGMSPRPHAAATATRPSRHGGWLATELNLSPQQQEQLNSIWSETARSGGHDRDDRRRQLFKQRDEAIVSLIRPEDKPRYDEILKKQSEQMAALDREWRSSFEASVEKTRQILTPEQRVKYEELLQRRQQERGSHDRHRGEGERDSGRSGDRHATSQPGSQS